MNSMIDIKQYLSTWTALTIQLILIQQIDQTINIYKYLSPCRDSNPRSENTFKCKTIGSTPLNETDELKEDFKKFANVIQDYGAVHLSS